MKFSDHELLVHLQKAVKDERNATLHVLNLLRETNDRQLHLKLGYGSLLEFCVKELRYSETSANRRISAMYAMLSVPVIEEKIQSGTLSLDVIAKAQSHIRQKEKISSTQLGHKVKVDQKERAEIFESLSGMSCREAEKELIKQDPDLFDLTNKKDSLRQITPTLQELKLILDEDMQADIEKLKLLISHINPAATIKEVLKFALKESIKKRDITREVKKRDLQTEVIGRQSTENETVSKQSSATEQRNQDVSTSDPKRYAQPAPTSGQKSPPITLTRTPQTFLNGAKMQRKSAPQTGMQKHNTGPVIPTGAQRLNGGPVAPTGVQKKSEPEAQTCVRVPISVAVKRLVWKKSQGQCCYRHQGHRCSSRFQLQIDHIVPLVKEGANDVSNLQLLCRQHNQLKGMRSL